MATPADRIVRMNAPRASALDCRGSFALWDGDGRLVTIRGHKARAILAYLVTYPQEPSLGKGCFSSYGRTVA